MPWSAGAVAAFTGCIVRDLAVDRIGWKLGFGTPAALDALGTSGPLVGALHATGRVEPEGLDIHGWTAPRVEPELALHLNAAVHPGASDDEIAAAISHVSLAFEFIDLVGPLDDDEAIVRRNCFQRAYAVGPRLGAASDFTVDVEVDGALVVGDLDPVSVVGRPVDGLRAVAQALGDSGERLAPGQVVITGSFVPPVPLAPGMRFATRARATDGDWQAELVGSVSAGDDHEEGQRDD